MYPHENLYSLVSPEDEWPNDRTWVGLPESSFKAIDCAESPRVILAFPTTWNTAVMSGNTALVLSP